MPRLTRIIALSVLLCLSTGAAEARSFKWDDIRRIKVGMTAEEVKKIAGKPTTIVSTNGVVQYSWVKVTWTGKASIAWIQLENGFVTVVPDIPKEFK